jgi:hypothetical protein
VKQAYKLTGYLAYENDKFLTAVPVFSVLNQRPPKRDGFFRQIERQRKIEGFKPIPKDALQGSDFIQFDSQVMRSPGDDAVFVEVNLSEKPIVASNWADFQNLLRQELKIRNNVDEVLGLELSRISGDLELEKTYLRRFVRLLAYQSPTVREHWRKSGLFSKGLVDFVDGAIREFSVLSHLSAATKQANSFAKSGFSSDSIRYFCSSSVLRTAGLFDPEVARDPITIQMRPLSEFEKVNHSRDVVLFSVQDFLDGDPEMIEEAIIQSYLNGASLVLVCLSGELPEAMDLFSSYGFILKKLRKQTDLCILSVGGEIELRSIIRKNHSAVWLEEHGHIATLKLVQ